jgi:hypothetical protein
VELVEENRKEPAGRRLELHAVDRLWLAFVVKLEVGCREVADTPAALIDHHSVETNGRGRTLGDLSGDDGKSQDRVDHINQ